MHTPGGPWIQATCSAFKQNSMASFWLSFRFSPSHSTSFPDCGVSDFLPVPVGMTGGTWGRQLGCWMPSRTSMRGRLNEWVDEIEAVSSGRTIRRRWARVRSILSDSSASGGSMDRADRSKVTEFASFSLRWSSHQSDRTQVIESKVLSWRIMLTIVRVPVDPPPSLHQPPRLPSLLKPSQHGAVSPSSEEDGYQAR